MYITACKENDNVSLVEDDFIEADRIEGHDRDDDQKYEFYKKFLQDTEKNFNNTQNESVIDGQIRFLELQERLIKSLKNNIQPTDYVICQELECPVCLTEMLPPTKIWNCKSGHTICQPCKRNQNIGRKCPTCRQEVIGRATTLEKIVAALYRKSTGMEPPVILNDDVEREESNYTQEMEQLVEMIFSVPIEGHRVMGSRPPSEAMGQELERLFNNLSVIQMTRPAGSRN